MKTRNCIQNISARLSGREEKNYWIVLRRFVAQRVSQPIGVIVFGFANFFVPVHVRRII